MEFQLSVSSHFAYPAHVRLAAPVLASLAYLSI